MNSAPSATMKNRNKNKSKFTCIPIGLTQGQFNLNSFKIPEQYKWFQMRSACLMAFCHLHMDDPLKWSSQTINKILINGAKVVKDNYLRVKEDGPLECVVNIGRYIAKIRIDEPIFLNTVESNTRFVETLQVFFDNHQYGLFRCLNLCYLLWKTNGIYFLFDGQGNGSTGDDKNGFASLVCTESLKDISKLLKSLSLMKSDDCYSITTITMKNFREGISESTKPGLQYAGTSTYTIVNESFAILSGKFHIGHSGFQSIKGHQSITVNLMALIYHAIQPANSWNSQLIDKIILLGTKLFHECKKTAQGEVTIQHLPRNYSVLQYKFKIDYKPYDHSGQKGQSLDEMKKNLRKLLEQVFVGGAKYKSVFIQTNSLIFAVWESNNFYYMFDAYARNESGEVVEEQMGTSCVQMHGSLESLSDLLATNLNAMVTNNEFVLHGVNVTLTSNDGKAIADLDSEVITTFLDDLFWVEMNNFQESSARSEEICNLDESSDDDIFMETIGGLKRAVSSVDSSESRSIASFVSESEASGSKQSSSKDSESASQSIEDSESQISEDKKSRSKSPKERRSKSPKKRRSKSPTDQNESREEVIDEQDHQRVSNVKDAAEQTEKRKKKSKKNKRKSDKGTDVGNDGLDSNGKKRKQKKGKHKVDDKKQSLAVVESSSGTETSIMKLLTTSFKICDRVLLVTEWGDFFVAKDNNTYYLCDGCLCDYNALIEIDLNKLDSSSKVDSVDDVVLKIMDLKNSKSVTIQSEPVADGKEVTLFGGVDTIFSGKMEAPLWELIESIIELMKTTAKFDKIKSELV